MAEDKRRFANRKFSATEITQRGLLVGNEMAKAEYLTRQSEDWQPVRRSRKKTTLNRGRYPHWEVVSKAYYS